MAANNTSQIDLRSDTVTKPTDEMRIAMATALVGDDVFGDDPTVELLEKHMAQLMGKEAALFVPSGTMGNLISCMVHCSSRDSEMIVGSLSHIHLNEQGGSATLGGIHSRVIENNEDGTISLQKIEQHIRSNDDHQPVTRLVCIENTHNKCGGKVIPEAYMNDLGKLCKKHNLKLHLDGARIFNASVVLGVSPARLVKDADSVSICLSKGLAAPVGSVIVGTKDFIRLSRRLRKALGGGMRQAGVLAACGMISLNKMVQRLQDDHLHAKLLAIGLNKIPGFSCDEKNVQTNIVFVSLNPNVVPFDAPTICKKMKEFGILLIPDAQYRIRFVTHYQFVRDDVDTVLQTLRTVCQSKSKL